MRPRAQREAVKQPRAFIEGMRAGWQTPGEGLAQTHGPTIQKKNDRYRAISLDEPLVCGLCL